MSNASDFINKEAVAGVVLIFCALLALIASNSSLSPLYKHFLDINFTINLDNYGVSKPLLLWINDGLMAVFFFLVGLELKREVLTGELRDINKAMLPIAGAIGGMVVPALVFLYFTQDTPEVTHAWAIPMATDIAFALGVLALFSDRVPLSLKLFLMTLAIIDDLGAILVIALFHTAELSWSAFFLATLCFFILIVLNRLKVSSISPYCFIGLLMWFCVLKSGFHATMAGVLLAAVIPMQTNKGEPMLAVLEHDIHPLVAFFILPLFAFANAGVPLHGITLESFSHPLITGIMGGLIIGKVVGIVGFTLAAKSLFRIQAPFNNMQLLAVSFLCGIGFTMSLFIAGLSFADTELLLNYSRLGILVASLIAMIAGILLLYLFLPAADDKKLVY